VRIWVRGAALLASSFWVTGTFAQGLPESASSGEATEAPATMPSDVGAEAPVARPSPSTTVPRAEPATRPAKTPTAPTPVNRPGIGLLAAAGLHSGFGLGARLGLGDLGLELAGGYQLLYAISGSTEDRKFDFGSSAQFGSELYFTPWHPTAKSAVGMKAGYRYNTVLEHGFAVAVTFLATLSPHLAFEGLAGAQVFPGSEGRLRRALDIPNGSDIVYGSQAQFFEYGFELIWYP